MKFLLGYSMKIVSGSNENWGSFRFLFLVGEGKGANFQLEEAWCALGHQSMHQKHHPLFLALPEKGNPLFLSKPPIKVEVLSSSPLLKIWLEVQPSPPHTASSRKGGVYTMRRGTPLICPSMVNPTRENVRLLKNFIFIDTSL